MALTFNHAAKRISVPQVDAQPLLVQSLINAIRDEEASERGICYDAIADAAGKDTLASGVTTGITLSLRSTWMLEFAAGAYQATITGGNLADALDRIYNPGSPQVLVNASVATTLAAGSGATPAEVWQRAIENGLTAEQILRLLAAAVAGDATGLDGASHVFKSLDGTKTRIAGTLSGGDRTITTRDAT